MGPQRLGVRLTPPALGIEWTEAGSGQLFNRQVDFQNLLPTTNAADLADQVRDANSDLLEDKVSPRQLISLVGRLTQSSSMPSLRVNDKIGKPCSPVKSESTGSTRCPSPA